MIRIIVEENDAGMAANVGGSVFTSFRTFDVEIPELEHYLSEAQTYRHRFVRGVEIVVNIKKEIIEPF